jgi:gp16 family phage-associated protein
MAKSTSLSDQKTAALLSPSDVLLAFRQRGETISKWANARGFAPKLVYSVLSGNRKCLRGESFRVAIALGIKPSPEDGHPL